MKLQETVRVLEVKHIEVALDLGEHVNCELDSNCPLAIQLRKIIGESGLTLPDLLEGYQAITAPEPVIIELPTISGEALINVAGKDIKVDLTEIVQGQLKEALERKLHDLDRDGRYVKVIGRGLYSTYLNEIAKLRDNHVLPQLKVPIEDLIKYGAYITEEDGNYVFLFQTDFHPEYIVNNGIRYKLCDEDIAAIRREAYLGITVTPQGRVFSLRLLDKAGTKMEHYHGGRTDCWGQVNLRLEGGIISLKALHRICVVAMNSLITINLNSLMQHSPPHMPSVEQLLKRSTKLGREGELAAPESTSDVQPTGWVNPTAPRRWGRRE